MADEDRPTNGQNTSPSPANRNLIDERSASMEQDKHPSSIAQWRFSHAGTALALDAMLLGAALLLSFVEAILPPLPLPGVKLGLANIVLLICTFAVGWGDCVMVAMARWLLMGLLFGGGVSMLFSLAGTLCVLAMLRLLSALPLCRHLSFVGISILTALAHQSGQLVCASILYGWGMGLLRVYGGGMVLLGTLCGALTGWLCSLLFRRRSHVSQRDHHTP